MIILGIKDLIKFVRLTGVTINLGFIELNFAGALPKRICYKRSVILL